MIPAWLRDVRRRDLGVGIVFATAALVYGLAAAIRLATGVPADVPTTAAAAILVIAIAILAGVPVTLRMVAAGRRLERLTIDEEVTP